MKTVYVSNKSFICLSQTQSEKNGTSSVKFVLLKF